MKRRLAVTTAKWLGKRKNRDKLKRTARKLRTRIEQEEGRNDETDDRRDAQSKPDQDDPHNDQTPPNNRK